MPADRVVPSVLDRLIDDEPDVSTEPEWRWRQDVHGFKESVTRDLEALLNTRLTPQAKSILEQAPDSAIAQSVFTYGLPDLTSMAVASQESRESLRWSVEEAIRRFEPRLFDVRVALQEPTGSHDRKLRLLVEAWLMMDPEPVAVVFDTEVEPAAGVYSVTSS